MFPGINQKQMQQMMKKMGISQENLNAKEVIIRLEDKEIVVLSPNVQKVHMMGEETFQITGKIVERNIETMPEISDSDIDAVVSQTNCSREDAVLEIKASNGDLAKAILKLSEKN